MIQNKKINKFPVTCLDTGEICYKDGILDIHHKTYLRIGNEELSDLVVLCRECHSEVHEKCNKNPRKTKYKLRKKYQSKLIKRLRIKKAKEKFKTLNIPKKEVSKHFKYHDFRILQEKPVTQKLSPQIIGEFPKEVLPMVNKFGQKLFFDGKVFLYK